MWDGDCFTDRVQGGHSWPLQLVRDASVAIIMQRQGALSTGPWDKATANMLITSGLSLTRVLNWISVKPIIYRLFSILNSDFIHNNLCFYNVWIYPRSHSATRIIRAACYRKFYFDFPSPLLAYSPLAKPARVPLTQLIPLFHTRIHTFNIVSLLLALMADLCLPLCAGEDTFELHLVQLELEAVERRIHELLGKQAQLRKRKATLETSRADAHKSGVSMQRAANTPTTSTPCVSLHRPRAPGTRSSQMAFTPALGNHGPWVQQRKTRSRPRATSSELMSCARTVFRTPGGCERSFPPPVRGDPSWQKSQWRDIEERNQVREPYSARPEWVY